MCIEFLQRKKERDLGQFVEVSIFTFNVCFTDSEFSSFFILPTFDQATENYSSIAFEWLLTLEKKKNSIFNLYSPMSGANEMKRSATHFHFQTAQV